MSRGPEMLLCCQSVLCMIRVSEKGSRRLFIPQKIPEGPQRARHCSLLSVGIVHIPVRGRL